MSTERYSQNNYESNLSEMKLITLQGHNRKLTKTKFNEDGDLLFSSSADNIVCVWDSINGERLGTYDGHKGVVNDFDIDYKSKYLLTGSGDSSIRIWNVEHGKTLHKFNAYAPISSVQFSSDNKLFIASSPQFLKQESCIHIYKNPMSSHHEQKQQENSLKTINIENDMEQSNFSITKAVWSPLNKFIFALCTDGTIRIIDIQKGKQIKKTIFDDATYHNKKQLKLTDFKYNGNNYCSAIICSRNKMAKMYDISNNKWEIINDYKSDVQLNCISIHPKLNIITMGGGEEAVKTAQCVSKNTNYNPLFYHKIYSDQFGTINTNVFSPLNSMDWNNDGTQLVLGYEQGQALLYTMGHSFYEGFNKWELEMTSASISNPSNHD